MSISISRWRLYGGCGFGFPQPILTGSLQADGLPDELAPAHIEAFAQLCEHLGAGEVGTRPLGGVSQISQWISILALAVLRNARIPVFQPARFATADSAKGTLRGTLIAPYADAQATIDSLVHASATVAALLGAQDRAEATDARLQAVSASASLIHRIRETAEAGVNSDRILVAANNAKIPFAKLVGNAYVFGQGHRSRWLLGTFTDRTSNLGTQMARNKAATSGLLAANGLPVARQVLVTSVDEALRAAETLGYPTVVKPVDKDNGVGVHAGLTDSDQVARCARLAFAHGRQILVESFQSGRDYRISVLNGRVIKAIERLAGAVVGNGRDSISGLVAQQHEDPTTKRRNRERGGMGLDLDVEALELLALAGLGPHDIPAAGERIVLRRRSNVSTGGTTRLVENVHPDNRKLAVDAALALRLDVAGVDLILPDIELSWRESGGIVCEVNAQPQLGEQDTPGLYRQFLVELLGGDGRIPTSLILTANPGRDQLEGWARAARQGSGAAIVVGGKLEIEREQCADFGEDLVSAARAAFLSARVRSLVIIASPAQVLRTGLPADRFDSVLVDSWADQPESEPTKADALRLVRLLQPHVHGRWTFRGDGKFGQEVATYAKSPMGSLSVQGAIGTSSRFLP